MRFSSFAGVALACVVVASSVGETEPRRPDPAEWRANVEQLGGYINRHQTTTDSFGPGLKPPGLGEPSLPPT